MNYTCQELKAIIKEAIIELQSMQAEELLTAEQVAELIKFKEETIRRWCASGYLPATKYGRSWRITIADYNKLKADLNSKLANSRTSSIIRKKRGN